MCHVRLSALDQKRYRDDRETDPTWFCLPRPRVKTPAGLKLTGHLRDENPGHLEREATKRRGSLETRLIYCLMFLDNNRLRSCSPQKKGKTPVQKKTMKHKKPQLYPIRLVSVFVFCGYGLYFWLLFQLCSLTLYFFASVFGWGCLLPFWDLCFCFLVVFFYFGFVLFYFCCCCLVVFLSLSATLYI